MLSFGRTVAAIVVVFVFALACRSQANLNHSRPALTEEQLSVYRGFLDKFSALHIKNLSKITVPLDFDGFPAGRPCLTGIELESLSESPNTAHVFGPEITKGRELSLVDPLEQTKLLQQASGNQAKESQNGQKKGSELNFLFFSEIAFDAKHQFAVLKYLLVCGEHCDSGETLVMEKVNGRWTTSSRRPCAMFVN